MSTGLCGYGDGATESVGSVLWGAYESGDAGAVRRIGFRNVSTSLCGYGDGATDSVGSVLWGAYERGDAGAVRRMQILWKLQGLQEAVVYVESAQIS